MTLRLCTLALVAWMARAELPLPFHLEQLRAVADDVYSGRLADPRQDLNDLMERAKGAGDSLSHAYARAGIGAWEERAGRWRTAEQTVREASLRVRDTEPEFFGRITLWLAQESFRGARIDRSNYWARLAMAEFTAAGDKRNLALAQFVVAQGMRGGKSKRKLLDEALASAREGGDPRDIAVIRIEIGEQQRQAGALGAAIENLRASSEELERLQSWRQAGRAFTMLGRAEIAHSLHREALRHLRHAEYLLEKSEDEDALLGARLELGKLYAATGQRQQAIDVLDNVRQSLDTARPAPFRLARLTGLAYSYVLIAQYQRAAAVAEEVLRRDPRRGLLPAYWILSCAYFHLGRLDDAVEVATTGISRGAGSEQLSYISTHRWRALALDKLGRHDEAARDIEEVNRLGDPILDRLVPEDEWKRSFLESVQQVADDGIGILWRAGKRMDALLMAEKFRARAFLDLLASRGADSQAVGTVGGADPRLSSAMLSVPPTIAQLTALARQGPGPMLCYWAHPDGIYAWVIERNGEIRSAHTAVPESKLRQLVERARRFQYKPDLEAWRELHRLVIQPVQPWLTSAKGETLTILPHRSLLQLPFAALLSANGRHLVEDFPLRVTPAAGLLLRPVADRASAPLLAGAPVNMLPGEGGKPLPALPGAQSELRRVAAILPEARLLSGPAMLESSLRQQATTARVLHFATHAVVDPLQPFQSFLALSDKGRLTVEQIYDLRLHADLVMMSACRSGSGKVSIDGLLGFTRAFLYAGAASVIAPLWDIPDEPTVRLVEEFYRQYKKGVVKSVALRTAQLKLLADLRAGRVVVNTPAGPMTLPDHPGIWAAFVLQGAD